MPTTPQATSRNSFGPLVGASKRMQELYESIDNVAEVDLPVLIVGETGTGKELVAREIHQRSKRKRKLFVALNMSAIPTELVASELFGHQKGAFTSAHEQQMGRFEEAKGGTLFLDEIITMDDKIQLSLLRVLESKVFRRVGGQRDIKTDVRIIASANQNPLHMVKMKQFRMDLLHRLQTLRINIPPLRKRKRDIERLVNHFLDSIHADYDIPCTTVSTEALQVLKKYSWPGNVRELKNVVLQACVNAKGEQIEVDNIPESVRDVVDSGRDSIVLPDVSATDSSIQHTEEHIQATDIAHSSGQQQPMSMQSGSEGVYFPLGLSVSEVEKAYVLKTLSAQVGNKSRTAKILGISRKALYDRLKRWGLGDES